MKKVLVYGKNSYIGEHYYHALKKSGNNVIIINSFEQKPKDIDFTGIDTVVNVVGIAHIKITDDMEGLFYKINTDLDVELCDVAKKAGVKQYIYMSSMNVFGDTTETISSREQEGPKNFYGKSKYLADQKIHAMEAEDFKIASVRPPVVYGKGCKGNFVLLQKVASLTPIFPNYKNKKSMIYIGHLDNFICELVANGEGGYFHPQNADVISTADTIVAIRKAMGKKTLLIPGFGWLVKIGMKMMSRVERAFADDNYDLEFSKYGENTYCNLDFQTTIARTVNG